MAEQELSNSVYILDGLRTPIGNPFKSFKSLQAPQLAGFAMEGIIKRNSIDKDLVSEVILGNTVTAGVGQNIAHQSAFLSGLPEDIPAYTVNNVCGSGLQSVILAVRSILVKDADLVIAGGTESATHCPYLINREDVADDHDGEISQSDKKLQYVDSLFFDGLFCQTVGKCMGELAEIQTQRQGISREDQDIYALESHRKACLAQEQGMRLDEILPIRNLRRKLIDKDDRPRKNISIDHLQGLPSAFKKQGTITSGNASIPCDGAAVVLVASKQFVQKHRIKPKARILGYTSVVINPESFFKADIKAIDACLKKCQLSVEDIDLFEIGEAFAAQIISTRRELRIPSEKLNILGGDIAIGHPLGAAGARILVTLIHALRKGNFKKGLVCICYGGGGASAMIIEAVN